LPVFRRRIRLPNTVSLTSPMVGRTSRSWKEYITSHVHRQFICNRVHKMFNSHALAAFDLSSLPSRTACEFQPRRPRLAERDLENLFEFIWKHDSYVYEHPRYRLQTALAILLFFHLGLYPTVALSEGFYYRDTTLLVANHNGAIRVLLVVCLDNRHKHQRSAKRWAR
jgi:hypothetical protein